MVRPSRQVWLCVRGWTSSNTQLNSGGSNRVSASDRSRKLAQDNLGQYAFWPYMHRDTLNKAAKFKSCTDIGKNLKPIIPLSKWNLHVNCSEPNKKIQIDLGGPITSEKDQDKHFLAFIDRFSKYPIVEVYEKTNGTNGVKFLDDYNKIHGVPRNFILQQARCLIGSKINNFCKQNNFNNITALQMIIESLD